MMLLILESTGLITLVVMLIFAGLKIRDCDLNLFDLKLLALVSIVAILPLVNIIALVVSIHILVNCAMRNTNLNPD